MRTLMATVLFGVLMASGGVAQAVQQQRPPCTEDWEHDCASDTLPCWNGERDSEGRYGCDCCGSGSTCGSEGCQPLPPPPTLPTPPPAGDECEGLEGACFGLCNAFCHGIKCQLPDQENQKPCERVLGNYNDPKHECPPMPCLQPPGAQAVVQQLMLY